MEKNNPPSFSICKKIRQALSSNLAFRSVHRIKQYYHQEPKPLTHPPQHINVSTKAKEKEKEKEKEKGEGEIPIKFDYSTTPSSTMNENSAISMVHNQASKVASPHFGVSKVGAKVEPRQGKHPTKVVDVKGEYNGVVGMVNLEQQGKKSTLDINDTFTEYIQRAKYRIKTVSNVGKGQSNSASDEANGCGANKMELQKDHFSDFIQQAKKKIRTTSSIRRTGSLKIVNSGLTKKVDH